MPSRFDQADMLCEEFEAIHGRPVSAAPPDLAQVIEQTRPEPPEEQPEQTSAREAAAVKLASYYASVHTLPRGQSALCLSGGGIRSAAFSLGVLQGLARRGLLSQFDYLSTVSGGGYIGCWLTAWAHRQAVAAPQAGAFAAVEQLVGKGHAHAPAEVPPLRWLRRNQKFLSPRSGVFSGDIWAGVALFVRDLLLNWLVYIPALMALLLLPRLLELVLVWWACTAELSGSAFGWLLYHLPEALRQPLLPGPAPPLPGWKGWTDMAGAFFAFLAMIATLLCRTSGLSARLDDRWFARLVLLPLLIGGWLIVMFNTVTLAGGTVPDRVLLLLWMLGVPLTFIAARLVAWAVAEATRSRLPADSLWDLACLAFGGATVGLLIWAALWVRSDAIWGKGTVRDLAVFGEPYLLVAFVGGQIVYSALACRTAFGRRDQEWMARASGYDLLAAVLWLGISGIVLYGQPLRDQLQSALALLGVTGGLTLATAVSSVSKATAALQAARQRAPVGTLVQLGALLFLLSGTVLLSAAVEALVQAWSGLRLETEGNGLIAALGLATATGQSALPILADAERALGVTALTAALLALTSLAMSLIVDVNLFSLHALYRNRLVRSFLGASNLGTVTGTKPQRSRFDGFSSSDDIGMDELWRVKQADGRTVLRREGPFPVINIALNLVGAQDPAWQERKAAPFVATPLHLGADLLGYVRHDPSANRRHLSLGTAMAISGAAASPNWGYHSSALISFLMMLFNVRLGWWLENPRKMLRRSPFWLRSLRLFTQEALGQTRADDAYVYLSDGGHFDNLGLYEMLRRRCSLIVAVDATQDQNVTMDDLGRTLRQVAIDLGITVEFAHLPFQKRAEPASAGVYAAIGTIAYPEGGPAGTLIYIKPGYYSDAPADVRAYAATDPMFPHDSTANQWFTESQFESYRALGAHVATRMTGPVRTRDSRLDLADLAQLVKTYLRPR